MGYTRLTLTVVHLRLGEVTALQADTLGLPLTRENAVPVVEISCLTDDPLARAAALVCEAYKDDGILVLDTARRAVRLVDKAPYSTVHVDWAGRPALWPYPRVRHAWLEPMPPVPGDPDLAAFIAAAAGYLRRFPPVDPARVGELEAAWRAQRDVTCTAAARHADAALAAANDDEKLRLHKLLSRLQYRAHNEPDMDDQEPNYEGEMVVPEWGAWIWRTAIEIHEAAEKIEAAAAERARKQAAIAEAEALCAAHTAELPEEAQLAVAAGMVPECLGMMRSALLPVVRPGWDYADEEFKAAANPPGEALTALLTHRERFPNARLAFRPGEKKSRGHLVIVDEFLGRTVVTTVP